MPNCLEHLADEAIGRPIGQANLASTHADARHLGCSTVLVGGKHHPEDRDDNVEAGVRKWQRLRVGLAELDVEAVGSGALAGALE